MKSAYSQADLLRRRIPIEEALKDPKLSEDHKKKLQLAEDARRFAEVELGLAHTKNYTTFVQVDAPYVTWVVSAAEKNTNMHLKMARSLSAKKSRISEAFDFIEVTSTPTIWILVVFQFVNKSPALGFCGSRHILFLERSSKIC